MNMIEIQRLEKEEIVDGEDIMQTVTGTVNDEDNFTETSLDAWDSAKTDYKIGEVVYVTDWFGEYTCLVDNTTQNPLLGKDWKKSGTISNYRYRDSSPTRQSFTDVDVPIVAILYLSNRTNYFFGQKFKNIKHIKVEGLNISDEVVETLLDEDLTQIKSFRKYDCCSLEYAIRTSGGWELSACNAYIKLRVTLTPQLGKIPKVGTLAVGKKIDIGCLNAYPTLKSVSMAKYEIVDVDLDLAIGAKYIQTDVSTNFNGLENAVDADLIKNSGKMIFFDINEFPEKNITKFVGFYKVADITPQQTGQKHKLQIYGVVSEDE